jgi:exopolysaccharide biosynthesis polyprenyl glycosylphosphotransferase
MTIASIGLFEPEDEFARGTTTARRAGVPRQRQTGQVTRLDGTPWPAAEDVDEPDEVCPVDELPSVPPARARAASPQPVARPVYDPFSARRRRTPEWLVSYRAAVVTGDVLAAVAVVLAAAAIWPTAAVPTALLAAGSAVAWPLLQLLLGSYAERRQGTGADEYRRVVVVGLVVGCALGLLIAGLDAAGRSVPGLARLLLVDVPAATVVTLLGRLVNRRRLHAARRRGLMTKHVVVVGRDVAVLDLVQRLRRDPVSGLRVIGVCVPRPEEAAELERQGIAVLGSLTDAVRVLDEVRADAVLVASASETAGHHLRDLAWRLEGTNIEVLVGPGLMEVAPNRLQVRPTTSVPLIQIQEPEFRGHRRLLKSLLDRVTAAVLLVLAAPLFIVIVAAIRLTSRGPAFYRHRRIGKRGREFDVLKFRSMVVDADDRIQSLMALNEGNAVQFKMHHDPRVTAVGRVIRKLSLDELPQLINVLKGEMSLVSPRPHVTREVEQYGPDMHRRLLVKPGITGLWQVSGRSDLSWDESVELDVRYVENWSLGLDLAILWRTVRAVLQGAGAY